MKILVYSDNHYCQYSSLLRGRGDKYSLRLENQIKSINWVEEFALDKGCSAVICGGDFFNSPSLNAEELTALQDIQWNNLEHIFLVGNHELGLNNLTYSSAHLFGLIPNAKVIDTAQYWDKSNILFLPYILENERKPLAEYCQGRTPDIIISHNDIKGVQMGMFISPIGFDVSDIERNCKMFINGHIHNGMPVSSKVLNIGNLTGQNFSEDASRYPHQVLIIDTEASSIETYNNPFALNFYKIDEGTDIEKYSFKPNSVVSVKAYDYNLDKVRSYLASNKDIICSRVILAVKDVANVEETKDELISVDHLEKFKEFILTTIGTNEIVNYELSEVTK